MENRMKDQGMISWFDVAAKSPDEVKACIDFYKGVFGYEIEVMPMPDGKNYTLFKMPGHSNGMGGVFESDGSDTHASKLFFTVDDVDATQEKVLAKGGATVTSASDAPGLGRMAVLKDNRGAIFGIISFLDSIVTDFNSKDDNAGRAQGIVSWFDILSGDVDASLGFYTAVFGYKALELSIPGVRYSILNNEHSEKGGHGGVGEIPAEVKDHLGQAAVIKYITVDNLESTVKAIKKSSGQVIVEKIEVPEMGSYCIFVDPSGTIANAFQYV